MSRVPASKRRNVPGLTRRKILVDYWIEISPFGYFMWRWRTVSSRFGSSRVARTSAEGASD